MSTILLSSETLQFVSDCGEEVTKTGGWLRLRLSRVSSSSDDDDETTIQLPYELHSQQTLEFLGFSASTASQLFQHFLTTLESFSQTTILDIAKAQIRSSRDAALDSDDWRLALDSMGIKPSLKDAIMDPYFDAIRLTKTATFWVVDTMMAKWLYLANLEPTVLKPRKGNKRYIPLQARIKESASKDISATPNVSIPGDTSEDSSNPIVATAVSEKAIGDTEIELFKGSDLLRLQSAIRIDSDTPGTNTNRLTNVLSQVPENFSGDESVLYFSKQREVAFYYADYAHCRVAEERQDVVDLGILTTSISVQGLLWR